MAEGTPSQQEYVRQLCRKLRPILGEELNKVFQAYCAEDTEGRQQIEEYLERLYFKYLSAGLNDGEAILIPPSKEQASGPYTLGSVVYGSKDLYDFGLREDEWIQHVAILGRTGAGKTNAAFVLLRELRARNKPFLVFDWKRNYRDLLAIAEFKDMEVYTIGRGVAPLTFNPLIPPEGTDPKTWLKKINAVICHAYCLGNGCAFLLQQGVDAVYQEAGVYDGTVHRWPTFKDVLSKARNMDTRGRESGWLSSTLRALSSLCFGEMDRLLNADNNRNLAHILDKSVVLELDALTQSDKVFFASSVLLWMHHKRMTETRRETLKHITLIEEAHHLLSDERRSLMGGQSVMEIVFREIREFGEALVLLDQHPSKISLPALGNCYTTICLNLKHKTDINAMGQCLLLDRERDILGMLDVGQAIVKLQGRATRPFQIAIPEFKIKKGATTDSLVRQHMQNSGPGRVLEPLAVTGLSSASNSPKAQANFEENSTIELALLKDVQEFPDSGIAARYKRLRLSVRQGQKLKLRLLKQCLIEEEMATTSRGRLTVIRLTTKGQNFLSAGHSLE